MKNYKDIVQKIALTLESDPDIIVEHFTLGAPISQEELDRLWPWDWGDDLKEFYLECNGFLLTWRHKKSKDFIANNNQTPNVGEYNVWQEENNLPTGIIQIYPIDKLLNNEYWKKWNNDLKKVKFDSEMKINGRSYSTHEGYENILPFDLYNPTEHTFLELNSGKLFRMYGYNSYYEESAFVEFDNYLEFLSNSFGLANSRADFFNEGKNKKIDLANPKSYLSDFQESEDNSLENLQSISDENDWILLFNHLNAENKVLNLKAASKIKEFIPLYYNKITIPPRLLLEVQFYYRKDFLELLKIEPTDDELVDLIICKWPSKMTEITAWYDSLIPAIDILEKTEKGKAFLRDNLDVVIEKAILSVKERSLAFLKEEKLVKSYTSFSEVPVEDPVSKNIKDIVSAISSYGPSKYVVEQMCVVLKVYPGLINDFDELLKREKDSNNLANYYTLISGQVQTDEILLFAAKKYHQFNKNKFLFKALPKLWMSSNEEVVLESLLITKSLGKQVKQLSPKLSEAMSNASSDNIKSSILETIELIS